MNINYHYYTIKTLAIYAGFPEEQAQCIAHFSQYVDDYLLSGKVIVGKKPSDFFFEYGLASEIKKGKWLFRPCPTGINFLESITDNAQLHTLTPFHFISKKKVPDIKADMKSNRKSYRCVEASQSSDLLVNQLMEQLVHRLEECREKKAFMELGMLIHTYADTYAHCNFSGFHSWENDAKIKKVYNKYTNKEEDCQMLTDACGALPTIGHGNIGTIADCCYQKIQYAIKDSKNDNFSVIYERDNSEAFGQCSRNIMDIFCRITGKEKMNDEEWTELQTRIARAQTVKLETKRYLTKSWKSEFPDIKYRYRKGQYFNPRLHKNHVFDRIFTIFAFTKKELHELGQVMGLGCKDLCTMRLKGANQDFFDYNELAYRRVKQVTGEYSK